MLKTIAPWLFTRITILVIAINVTGFSYAQDYGNYYDWCYKADSLNYVDKPELALDYFNKAFQSVDYVWSEEYRSAAKIAIAQKQFKKAYHYLKLSVIHSGKSLDKIRSRKFRKSKYGKWLTDSTNFFLQTFNHRVNHKYMRIIDSLFYIDQHIIRNSKSCKRDYQIDPSTIPENKKDRFKLDDTNWNLLYYCIQKYGFPSEKNVGLKIYREANIIIWHNLRKKKYERYHPLIFEAIEKGEYLPYNLSVWYEQNRLWFHDTTFFFMWDENTSQENKDRINRNRRKYHLKSLNAFKIKAKGRKLIGIW